MSCTPNDPARAPRLVGDPIDAVTGAQIEVAWELVLPGRVPFEWVRHYDSSRVGSRFALGWGHAHGYERTLRFDADGMRYVGPLDAAVAFPVLLRDGAEAHAAGLLLRRLAPLHYHVEQRGRPTMEFRFTDPRRPTPLGALLRGDARLDFRYSADGALAGVDEPGGRSVRVQCDDAGRVRRLVLVGPDGDHGRDLVAYDYDQEGNLVRGVDAYRNAYLCRHDAAHRVVRRTHQNGYSFHFAFDPQGRCVRSSGQDGLQAVRLEYRPEEMRTLVTKADGGVWEYRYDDAQVLTEIVDPYGGSRRFQLDDAGNVAAEIDPNGDVTQWVYDGTGALLGKRSSLGHFAAGGDDPLRPDQRTHRVPERPSEWEYGDLLSPGAIGDDGHEGDDRASALSLEVRRLAALVSPRGDADRAAEPRDVHDELGTRLRTTRADGRARSWSYDAGGNVVRYHDFDGALTQCEYASWDLPVRRIDPLGRSVTRRFTASEQVAEEIDPAGVVTAYVYDLKGRVVEWWYDGVCVERYRYDAADNLVATLDGAGAPVLEHAIGTKNLRTERRLASGATHRFEYTERGDYAAVATDDVRVTFGYDEHGSRTRDVRDGRGVEHAFAGPGTLTRTTVLERFTTRYRRSASGTLEIRDPGGATHELHFLGRGVVVRRMSSGLIEAVGYDAQGQCTAKASAHARTVGASAPWVRRYAYSGEGDLLEVHDSAVPGRVRYEYDAAHRLVREIARNGVPGSFRHDAGDNLVEQPGLAAVSIAGGNRLVAAGGETFEYDARGNVAVRRAPGGTTTTYRYDSRNMLVACATARGEWRASYDPLGRRVRTSLGDEWCEYVWDTDRLAAELRHDGRLRVYVYADAFAIVPLLWLDYHAADADPSSGRRYFVQCDHLGTPVRVESEGGDVVWRAAIGPYGAIVAAGEARVEMPFRFPGQYFDAATGLHYNRFRYYDPVLGRYLQPDPLGTEGGRNLYAYSANPLREVDVRGDCPANGTATGKPGSTECGDKAKGKKGDPGLDRVQRLAAARAAKVRAEIDARNKGKPTKDHEPYPLCTVAVRDKETGKVYYATSGQPALNPSDAHPDLGMPTPHNNKEPWPVGNCAEPKAMNAALNDGARKQNLQVAAVNTDDGSPKQCCRNCVQTTKGTTVSPATSR